MLFGFLWMAGYLAIAFAAIAFATRAGRARRHVAAHYATGFETPGSDHTPGSNQAALDTCNAIWNAQARKETP
jgi:hypothetical protein